MNLGEIEKILTVEEIPSAFPLPSEVEAKPVEEIETETEKVPA
jgi:hypothetical protein